MKNQISLVRNSRGVSVIEVVFALMISAVGILTINMFMTQMNTENKKLSDNSTTARKNYDFLELMNNPTMWKATVLDVNNYSFFSCKLGLNQHPDIVGAVDCSKIEDNFRIIGGNQEVIYDQEEKDAAGKAVGFTAEGVKCFGFDANSGSDTCPTHYKISWDLPCVKSGSCKEPMAKVMVTQITKYQTKSGLNSEKTFNLNINLPQSVEIAPRDSTYMVNINTSEMEFDVLKTDFSVDTFNLKVKSASSSASSSVSIKNNKIAYIPKANFYGVDKIYYTIEQNLFDKVTKSEGVVWVKVMTPYTWVGDGPVAETSFSGKKWYDVYDKRNWCGSVVDGKCNHFGADKIKSGFSLTNEQMKDASLVFNENCNNCNVLLKGLYTFSGSPLITVNAIEMGANFPGEIKQVDDLSIYIRRNSANRNSNDPELLWAFSQKGGSFLGANSKADFVTDEVYAQKRNFQISKGGGAGIGPRSITRGSLTINTYGHFAVEGGKFYAPESMNLISGFNHIKNQKNFFHQNGTITVSPRYNAGNIFDAQDVTLNDFIINFAGGFDYNILGNMSVRDLSYYQTGYESQLRGYIASGAGSLFVSRNIYLRGGGGFMVNGWGGWGYAKIVPNGKGDQYIYSNLDLNGNKDRSKIGRLPVLVVNKPDGILHIKGDLGFTEGIDYQAGTLKFYDDEERAIGDRQMIELSSAWNVMYLKNTSGGELVLPNFELTPQCAYMRFDTDLRITGDFIQDKRKYNPQCSGYPFGPKTRKIYVEGNIYARSGVNEHDMNGLVTIEMTGNKDQKIIGPIDGQKYVNRVSNGTLPEIQTNVEQVFGYLPHVDVKKSGGKVTMEGAIGFMERFRVLSVGSLDASNATISFINTNGSGAGTIDLSGLPTKKLTIKGMTFFRNVDLSGSTITITGGLNLPAPPGGNNNVPSLSNGTILLMGNLYYNDNFDKVTSDVNRAKIKFVGSEPQTIYATMSQATPNRVGSFEIEIDKTPSTSPVKLDCQGDTTSMLYMESLKITEGNLQLDNCSLKVAKKIEIDSGTIDRGASPGQFLYKNLINNGGKIEPSVVAGP